MSTLRNLTGNKDVDKTILQNIDSDRTLLETCSLNSYLFKLCDDNFFYNRMKKNYSFLINKKPNNINWKQFYLQTIYYIDKMKREYDFNYTSESFGLPKKYYDILSRKKKDSDKEDWLFSSLMISANEGFKDLARYFEDKLHNNT
jgi:hypothetical protein